MVIDSGVLSSHKWDEVPFTKGLDEESLLHLVSLSLLSHVDSKGELEESQQMFM